MDNEYRRDLRRFLTDLKRDKYPSINVDALMRELDQPSIEPEEAYWILVHRSTLSRDLAMIVTGHIPAGVLDKRQQPGRRHR